MAFEFDLPIHYASIDYARIVYYPQFVHFCHVTKEEMFPVVVGVTYAALIQEQGLGYPTVKSEAEFLGPVAYGDRLRMRMTVERLGESSVDFRYEGRRLSDGELAFRVRNTEVCVEIAAWNSTPIPDSHRKAFQSLFE
jgi:YbgC/YbaW family acyl-CoA thioester hydrolase